jgi:isopentenyl phosphate kinase
LNNNAIVIGKSGDSDLTCGMLVKVEQMSGVDKEMNEKMFGNYLVKSIKHKITQAQGYEQICLLTKPFYGKDPQNLTKKVSGRINK